METEMSQNPKEDGMTCWISEEVMTVQ